MTSKKVFFVDAERMRQGFKKMVEANPSLACQKMFFNFLLTYAGEETNFQHAVSTVTLSLGYILGIKRISLDSIVETLLDDEETIRLVKNTLERIALHMEKDKAVH
jgi:hypothetical protein